MPDDVYRAHTYEDLINALPTFFGFVPRECVIAVAVSGPYCAFGFRLRNDLPPRGSESRLAAELAPHLLRNGTEGFFVFVLSSDAERARTMALAMRDALPARRDWLTIWADDHRIWADVPGHPPEGEPYTRDAHHEAIVRAVANGQVILPDRSDLAREVAAAPEPRRSWLDRAHDVVLDRFLQRAAAADETTFLRSECARVECLVTRALGGSALDDGELVELAVLTSSINVRDAVWLRIDRDNAPAMHALWAAVSRVAADDFAPAPLCLTSFAAWQMGDGARALVALDRVREVEPRYRMGILLQQTLDAGLHPDSWSAIDASA
ncbi:hypothetical protein AFL01nite_26380 [Aeromicrobium flavum]|uniref:DUF4192 domain-containing protein n=1 Tax=Aeromicrobium flavum TaxID=416568 RepID=A0A512HXY6_9ACTN|nr:DUF4192 domain-containing protein [Aeromicrobium flavum]GEO90311.1 hypothetical protein AFL01nite_26380 [Aeromicrobium flavum]